MAMWLEQLAMTWLEKTFVNHHGCRAAAPEPEEIKLNPAVGTSHLTQEHIENDTWYQCSDMRTSEAKHPIPIVQRGINWGWMVQLSKRTWKDGSDWLGHHCPLVFMMLHSTCWVHLLLPSKLPFLLEHFFPYFCHKINVSLSHSPTVLSNSLNGQ